MSRLRDQWERVSYNQIRHKSYPHISVTAVNPNLFNVNVGEGDVPFTTLIQALDFVHHSIESARVMRRIVLPSVPEEGKWPEYRDAYWPDRPDEHGRIPHFQVRGGREAFKGPLHIAPSIETQKEMYNLAPNQTRTQSPGTRQWLVAHTPNLEEKIQKAIDAYMASSDFAHGFKVPYNPELLIAVGMPEKAAKILVNRAKGVVFLTHSVTPAKLDSLFALIKGRTRQNISIRESGFKNKGGLNIETVRFSAIDDNDIKSLGTLYKIYIKRGNRTAWVPLELPVPETNIIKLHSGTSTVHQIDELIEYIRTLIQRNRKMIETQVRIVDPRWADRSELVVDRSEIDKINTRLRRMRQPPVEWAPISVNRYDKSTPNAYWTDRDIIEWLFNYIETRAAIKGKRRPLKFVFNRYQADLPEDKLPKVIIDLSQPVPHLQHSDAQSGSAVSPIVDYRTLEGVTLQSLPSLLAKLMKRRKHKGKVLPVLSSGEHHE